MRDQASALAAAFVSAACCETASRKRLIAFVAGRVVLAEEKAALALDRAVLAEEKAALALDRAIFAEEKAVLESGKVGLESGKVGLAEEKIALAEEKADLAEEKDARLQCGSRTGCKRLHHPEAVVHRRSKRMPCYSPLTVRSR